MIIFEKMKNKFGLFKISVVELAGAFLIGILIACLTRTAYSTNSDYIDTLLFLELGKLDKLQLLIFVIQFRLKEYLLIWLFSITVLAIPYNTCYILYKGFTSGFVIGALAVLYGWKGLLCGLSLGMPHYIVYIIVLLQTVLVSYKIHERSGAGIYGKRTRVILKQLPAFLVFLSMTIIGCFMETFLNPSFVTWVRTTLKLLA